MNKFNYNRVRIDPIDKTIEFKAYLNKIKDTDINPNVENKLKKLGIEKEKEIFPDLEKILLGENEKALSDISKEYRFVKDTLDYPYTCKSTSTDIGEGFIMHERLEDNLSGPVFYDSVYRSKQLDGVSKRTAIFYSDFPNDSYFEFTINEEGGIEKSKELILKGLLEKDFNLVTQFIVDEYSHIHPEDIHELEKQGYLSQEQADLKRLEIESVSLENKIDLENVSLENNIDLENASLENNVDLEVELDFLDNKDFSPSFFQKFISKVTNTFSKQKNNEPTM